MSFLLRENDITAALAAKYVFAIHNARDSWFFWDPLSLFIY